MSQEQAFEQIFSLYTKVNEKFVAYWKEYSYFDTWQFWVTVAMLVLPLILLYLVIDRRNILLIGFYGFNVHSWFGYADTYSNMQGWIKYPYFIVPSFPAYQLEASLIPVLYMLVYQWTLNNKKNFYIYSALLSAVLAFFFKPVLVALDLVELGKGKNYLHILFVYIGVFLLSKAIASLFLHLSGKKQPFAKKSG